MKKNVFLRLCQLLCLFFFFWLLTHSDLVLSFARKGIRSWAFSVLPVLLPFIILSKFWIYCGIPEMFFAAAKRTFPGHHRLTLSASIFFLGLVSGFPVGAVFVAHYYQQNLLSKKTAELLLPLCSFISPMFLLGYVRPQTGYTGSSWYSFVFSLYLPVVFFFYKACQSGEITTPEAVPHAMPPVSRPVSRKKVPAERSSIRKIWLSSLEIIFTIGIYMMLFSILFGLALHEPLLQSPLTEILLANLEITTGVQWLAHSASLKGFFRGMVLSATVSFGGLCTAAQVYSITLDQPDNQPPLSLGKYLQKKGQCALASALLFALFTFIRYRIHG